MTDYINLIIQIILIATLSVVVYLLFRSKKSLEKERRLARFSIDAINGKQVSFFDKIEVMYHNMIEVLSKKLTKLNLFNNYSKKYEKYIDQTQIIRKDSMDFIAHKILISLLTVTITIVSDVLRVKNITILQLLISVLAGFFIPDIFLYFQAKNHKKRVENDLLKAVTIMNNAFKSGRSIMQAVELVYLELDGPISDEFRKMFIDLTYGLELEVVFNRFAERIPLSEIKYMASSLVILNKTGGNVVKVFNSIEKGFFDRKKLNEELKSSTALSDLVFKVLVVLPILLFIIVYIFNNNYYDPLFNTVLGRILIVLILIIYILYIIIVNKIVRLEE